MKKTMTAALVAASLLFASFALAEGVVTLPGADRNSNRVIVPTPDTGAQLSNRQSLQAVSVQQEETAEEKAAREEAEEAERLAAIEEAGLKLTTEYRWFVSQYRNLRTRKVTYYDNVYAYNHGEYGLAPFDGKVPPEYFVVDSTGAYAVAPLVMDITDAMRVRLYGDDVGEVSLLYGQYCERISDGKGHEGFSGVHEGIDFTSEKGSALHAILGGVVTRAGDSNGTVAIYNEDYDMTVLYLHCYDICVRRGDEVEPDTQIAVEGKKGISGYDTYYTHIEVREGRHTTSNPYRNVFLESDCPYPLMQDALGVEESGRQPATAAAVLEAQRMREEAEAAARAEAEAELEAQQAEAEPEIELVDVLPEAGEGYGFTELTPEAAPEATLPPN